MITIIRTKEDFEQLRERWGILYQNSINVTIFQTFEYNWIAWATMASPHDQLYIIVDFDHTSKDKTINGIFPFYIDKKKTLRFINDIHTDFCNAIISKEIKGVYDLFYRVWDFIMQEKYIKFVFLDNVISSSLILSYWRAFARNGFVFAQTEHAWIDCPKASDLTCSFPHLRAKERDRLKNIQKKIDNEKLEVLRIDDTPFPINDIDILINQMCKNGIRDRGYFNPKMLNFIQNLYEAGLIEISIIKKDNQPLCLYFNFVDDEKRFTMLWIILYSEKKYNIYNNLLYFLHKSSVSNATIDFGRGAYDYKMTNFRPLMENVYRFMYSKTKWGNWYIFFKVCASHARKTIAKYRKKK